MDLAQQLESVFYLNMVIFCLQIILIMKKRVENCVIIYFKFPLKKKSPKNLINKTNIKLQGKKKGFSR